MKHGLTHKKILREEDFKIYLILYLFYLVTVMGVPLYVVAYAPNLFHTCVCEYAMEALLSLLCGNVREFLSQLSFI
jgi:hypothetical protein